MHVTSQPERSPAESTAQSPNPQAIPQTSPQVPSAQVPSAQSTLTLHVSGMKCAGCVKAVEKKLAEHSAVASASVNLVTTKATVMSRVDASNTSALAEQLADTLTAIGFPTTVESVPFDEEGDRPSDNPSSEIDATREDAFQDSQAVWRSPLAIAIILLILSTIGHLKHIGWLEVPVLSNIWFHFGLATLALVLPGREILVDGWRGLRHGIPNMNTLVGMGMLASYGASAIALVFPSLGWECFFDEPVMLVGFILLGRTLEHRARVRAANAIEALFSLQPKTAQLLPVEQVQRPLDAPADTHPLSSQKHSGNGKQPFDDLSAFKPVEIPTRQVQVGQWLRVLPGEQIPVDGEVISGETTVDESMLTGESMPVAKVSGDRLSAGSLNQSGAIAMKATRVGKDTTLAHIVRLVEEAQTRKAPVQKLADTVAGYFAYGVMAIATVTFLFWYFVGTHLWPSILMTDPGHHAGVMDVAMGAGETSPLLLSLKLAIAVLVIACPCALGLATPTAIMVGSGIGAERGLLIRGGDVLEQVHRLDTLVFDKTGTLTKGQPVVTHIQSLDHAISEDKLLALAASAEQGTRHPIAHAIQQTAEGRSLSLLPTQNVKTEAGSGVTATIDQKSVWVGKRSWLQGILPLDERTEQAIDVFEADYSGSSILVATQAADSKPRVVGLLAIEDELREDAQASLAHLQQMNLEIRVLTGDRRTAAEPIIRQLGLSPDALIAEVHPDQKAAVIESLQKENRIVGMVGDGINDAPALAQADVGIALHSGTDVAVETSDIVLMRDRLSDVAASIRLGRKVVNKIRQNLFWALAYNTIGIPVAAGVLLPAWDILLSPASAGAMMAFSSVSVVVNALLLRRSFPTPNHKPSSQNHLHLEISDS